MGLTVTVLSGKRLGARYQFSDERGEITIGRAPEGSDKVDVRLDPYDAGCSRDHAWLERAEEGWVLHVKHENGAVLANRGQGSVELGAGDDYPVQDYAYLTLGPEGPCLFLAVDPGIVEDEMPQTQAADEVDDLPPINQPLNQQTPYQEKMTD